MENKSREIPSPSRTAFGPLKDVKGLHVNGSASVAELKEFLASLKGKNPQEVIGLVSSSLLIQSLTIATVATVLFFAVFTVVPYFVYGPPKAKDLAGKAAAKEPSTPAKTDAAAQPATTDGAKSKTPDAAKAAKALGIDEIKDSDPTKNPLDKGPNIDNLLDGLDK